MSHPWRLDPLDVWGQTFRLSPVQLPQPASFSRSKKLEDLLEKSFSLVKMPSLQPVVMCVMKHLPKVPEKKLKLVTADKELYRACAVEVKRQIWQDNQALFGDEVSPLLKQYILEKESTLFSSELSVLHNFFSPSPKTRRQGEVVQRLTQMVGRNVKLYDMVLQFLRTLFLRTRNVHYCTLRAELLMCLHELDVGDICSVDPCHKVCLRAPAVGHTCPLPPASLHPWS